MSRHDRRWFISRMEWKRRRIGRITLARWSGSVIERVNEDKRQSGVNNIILLVAIRFWETPVHIPNTMVKTKAADDTILVTVWESRWLPDQKNNWFYQWSEDSKNWGFWWLINIQSDCTLKTSYRDKYWEKYLWKHIFDQDIRENK